MMTTDIMTTTDIQPGNSGNISTTTMDTTTKKMDHRIAVATANMQVRSVMGIWFLHSYFVAFSETTEKQADADEDYWSNLYNSLNTEAPMSSETVHNQSKILFFLYPA